MRVVHLILLTLLACGKSAADHLQEARGHLSGGQYDPAIASAGLGLQASPDDKTTWGLELVVLEANARAGKVAETKTQLGKLEANHAALVQCSLYSATADQLKAANQGAGAIEVLDLGTKKCPDDPVIAKAIEASKQSADPAQLEKLKTLGYIE